MDRNSQAPLPAPQLVSRETAPEEAPTRMVTLIGLDDVGLQWDAKLEGVSRMELPTILRLIANMTEKAITGAR